MRRYKGKMNVALIATGKTLWRHSRLPVLVGVGVLVEVPTAELQVPHSRAPPVTPTREAPASAARTDTAATTATASAASAALEGVAAAAAAAVPRAVAPGPVAPDQWEGESQEGRALLPRGRRLLLPRAAWAA